MITYELCLLLRIMPKPEVVSTLRRTANSIFQKGGIIRKLENLGTKDMPHKTRTHGLTHFKASYFLVEFTIPPKYVNHIFEEYGRDVDIIRRRIYKKEDVEAEDCTLHEELQPPPYRKSVQDLITQARKLDKPKFDYKSGLDYYPFQK